MTSHDPTTPDRQGADRGTQYRSIILYHDAKQKQTVDMVLKSLKSSFPNSIVTEVAPLEAFYNAEIYHQNYFNSNSTAGYCRVVIDPKIKKIRWFLAEIRYKLTHLAQSSKSALDGHG